MIQNSSFEQNWAYKRVWVVEKGSPPREMPTGNCFIQEPWEFWWEQGPDLHLTEVKDAWKNIDAHRVHSGEKAIQFFKSWDQYHAGFYQQVEVPGEGTVTIYLAAREQYGFCHNDVYWDDVELALNNNELILSVWCHAWSNHGIDHEHEHDPRWSDGVGDKAYYNPYLATPEPNGDPWNDAIRNVSFRLGIDMTGGTNPLAATVRWSPWMVSYNEHHQVTHAIALGQQPANTVGYEVTVHVPNQHVEGSYDRVHEIARPTFGSNVPSHDDAGRLANVICPSGNGGRVILYDIPDGEHQAYLNYYQARYPRAMVEFEAPDPSWAQYLLAQGDPRWGDHVYADGQCYALASQGCWITCCAMALRVLGIKGDATPVTVDETLGAEGYTSCLMLHSMMPKLGLEVKGSTTSLGTAKNHIDQGGVLFIEVLPTSLMHFVLGVAYEGDRLMVLDPWKDKVAWLDELYEGAEAYRLVGEIDYTPPPPPPPSDTQLVGLHMQSMEGGWDNFYRRAQGRAIAKVFSPEDVLHVLRQCPDANVIVRPYVPNQQPFLYPANDDFDHAGKLWVDNMRYTLYRVCDQIAAEFPGRREPYFIYEGPNEEYENVNTDKNRRATAIDTAVAMEAYNTGYPFVAGVYCAAVGNLDATEFYHLVGMAENFRNWPAHKQPWWGYHGYFLRNRQYGGPDHLWQYLAGRFAEVQKVLPYQVPWYGGEGGAIGGKSSPPEAGSSIVEAGLSTSASPRVIRVLRPAVTSHPAFADGDGWVAMYPDDGWRHPEVYNGDWMAHQADLERKRELAQAAVEHWMGDVVFTTNAHYMGWKHFRVKAPQMELMIP